VKRVLFVPWSVVLIDGKQPADARQGVYGRQVPRYLSIRLEETAGLAPTFAPYCAESEEGTLFVVSGTKQTAEELLEIGAQYGTDYVVGGCAQFLGSAQIELQVAHVPTGFVSERRVEWPLDAADQGMERLLDIVLEEIDPFLERPAETECAQLSPSWDAASPFFCALDRLMALEIGNVVEDPPGVYDLFFEAIDADPQWMDGIEQLIGTALDYEPNGPLTLEHSIEAMERLVLKRNDLHKAWEALGYLYEQSGLSDESMVCLEQAYELDSEGFASHHRLGSFLRRTGRTREAEHVFREGLLREPDHIPLINELGVLLGEQGAHDEAAELFRRALRLSPVSGAFYANLGVSLYRAGQIEEAERVFKSGLLAVDPHWHVYLNYAGHLQAEERHAEWAGTLFQGIQTLGNRAERLDLAARLADGVRGWLERGVPGEVQQRGNAWLTGLVESVVELLPEHRSSALLLSELYRRDGRLDRALQCLTEVAAEEPDNVWLNIHIGAVLAAGGEYDEASLRFQRALAVDGTNKTALSNLLMIASRRNRYDEAFDYQERCRAASSE